MIYKAKVDWWIGLALLVGVLAPAVQGAFAHQWAAIGASGLFTAIVCIVLLPQSYEVDGDALRVRHGVMTETIPWTAVTSVGVNADSRSSFALSLDRVLVEYGGKSVIIAPDDQARFFDDVAARCPQLSRRGMDLLIALNP